MKNLKEIIEEMLRERFELTKLDSCEGFITDEIIQLLKEKMCSDCSNRLFPREDD